jgi:hypothetical protein
MTTIDAAKYHHGNGADTLEDAAWHIGVFLLFCAERGMAAPEHGLESLRADATLHLLRRCDGKLWRGDLTAEGAAFADHAYEAYLAELGDLTLAQEVDVYSLGRQPQVGGLRDAVFEFLDDMLEAQRVS